MACIASGSGLKSRCLGNNKSTTKCGLNTQREAMMSTDTPAHDEDTIIALIPNLLPATAALAPDTHHLELQSKPDTDDTFPGQGILGINLIHHPVLLR